MKILIKPSEPAENLTGVPTTLCFLPLGPRSPKTLETAGRPVVMAVPVALMSPSRKNEL